MGICVSSEVKRHRRRQRQRHGRGRERERGRAAVVRKHSEMARESPSKPDGRTSRFSMVNKNINDLREAPAYSNVDIFTYDEIKYATKHFRPDLILGEGGFGVVYKGVINENMRPGYKTKQVAIKELNRDGFQGDREWLAEVNYLGQLSHPNLVKLSGYCCEDEHRILVYEYMENGSLEKHIFRRAGCSLTWPKRMKIALDAAKGLAFLHGAERPIIYRDFKTSNILLDADFNAKLSDFGLAKEGPMGDQTHVSTRVMGTHGYAAPEYIMTGHLTARSDVYGFGVVLLEMLIGRRVMDKSRPSQEYNLVEWARPLLNHNKKLSKILDPKMEGQYSTRTIIKVAHLAYQCLSQNPKGRPLMSQVVELLEGIRNKTDSDLGDDAASGVTIFEDTPEEINSMRSNSERKTERRGNRPRSIRSKSEPPKDFDLCCPSTDYTPNLVSNEKPDIF